MGLYPGVNCSGAPPKRFFSAPSMVISWFRRVVSSLRFWVSAFRKGRKGGRTASANWARKRASKVSVLASRPVALAKLTGGWPRQRAVMPPPRPTPAALRCLRWPPAALPPDSGVAVALSATRCRPRRNRRARRCRRGECRHVHPGFDNVDANVGGFLLHLLFLLTGCLSLARCGLVYPGHRSGSIVEGSAHPRFATV